MKKIILGIISFIILSGLSVVLPIILFEFFEDNEVFSSFVIFDFPALVHIIALIALRKTFPHLSIGWTNITVVSG